MNENVKLNRHKYIGGSDIPIILGISPFKTRYDLLLEKAQIVDDDFQGNKYTDYGNALEPKIRNYIIRATTIIFMEDCKIKNNYRANVDGYYNDCILEIKTTSQIHKKVDSYKSYLAQLLFYMKICDCPKGMLAVYNRPKDFSETFDKERLQIFTIESKNYEYETNNIFMSCEKFWLEAQEMGATYLLEDIIMTKEELWKVGAK